MKNFLDCKYGMFIHHTLPWTHYSNGTQPQTIDELADAFDTEGFADSLLRMGVEYIVFTAWHFQARPLYPSAVTEKWRPGLCPKRDLLGDIIDSVKARGIHVIFYTHPRDGHDFTEEDKIKTGWGAGGHAEDSQQPDYANFNYEKWNEYTLELYNEFAERYAAKITGYYTDSNGPKDPSDLHDPRDHHQVVNYLKIRNIMKSHNPNLVTFQNYYNSTYTQDYGNSETYTQYISSMYGYKHAEKWHCSRNVATTLIPFNAGWSCAESNNGGSILIAPVDELIKYTLFNGSCSDCGNVLFASAPFAEGNIWSTGVEDTMIQIRNVLSQYTDSFMNARPSNSYPTLPGSTLEDNKMRFFMTNGNREYLHLISVPQNGVIEFGLPEDDIKLCAPVSDSLDILSFEKTENGYKLTVKVNSEKLDHVIAFNRCGTPLPKKYEWINSSDKRMCYTGCWFNSFCSGDDDIHRADGNFERELYCSCSNGDCLTLVFEGSAIELYGAYKSTYGKASVYIDGIFCAELSEYAPDIKPHVLLYRSEYLYGGRHVLQVYANDDKLFTVDAVKVIF